MAMKFCNNLVHNQKCNVMIDPPNLANLDAFCISFYFREEHAPKSSSYKKGPMVFYFNTPPNRKNARGNRLICYVYGISSAV